MCDDDDNKFHPDMSDEEVEALEEKLELESEIELLDKELSEELARLEVGSKQYEDIHGLDRSHLDMSRDECFIARGLDTTRLNQLRDLIQKKSDQFSNLYGDK